MAAKSSGKTATAEAGGVASALASAGRELMKDRAYVEIKRFIQAGDLTPGLFLAERQLAERLGMSKTPVRAALERLEAEGFVTISPQQGIIVRDLTVHEIAEQYEIRAALEGYTVRTLAGHLTPLQVERLRDNLRSYRELKPGEVSRGVELDTEFHTLFPEFLGNREILRVTGQLREKVHRVITKVFQINPGRIGGSYDEHCAIAEAVIRGDGPEAARLVEQHLEYGKQFLLTPRRGSA
jgi:DNA-binding GntR family transcriptional regulator